MYGKNSRWIKWPNQNTQRPQIQTKTQNNWTLMTDRVHRRVRDHNPIYALIALFMSNVDRHGWKAVCLSDREQVEADKEIRHSSRIYRGQNTWLVRARKSATNQSEDSHGFCHFILSWGAGILLKASYDGLVRLGVWFWFQIFLAVG